MIKGIDKIPKYTLLVAMSLIFASCSPGSEPTLVTSIITELPPTLTTSVVPPSAAQGMTATPEGVNEDRTDEEKSVGEETEIRADVISISVSGSPHQYQFSVEISSPDTGCEQYADWWEVLSEDGELIYRRILLHSHVSDQPFTRSGGPVNIGEETVVIIRAHMNQVGYGGISMKGSIKSGFRSIDLLADFSVEVENQLPLPAGCNF